jgi:hypothetical protein
MNLSKIVFVLLFVSAVMFTVCPTKAGPPVTISFCPENLPWEEVQKIIPNKSFFTVIDVETGLHFQVQRRAGSNHADVQPVTKRDTEIMKKIYGGKWSWKRRAIFVKINDLLIAASMHGMPHGAGALNNGFPGHFCIHFYKSTTHGSNKMDEAHKIMILKAAGKLDEYATKANPYEIIELFLMSLNQDDLFVLKQTVSSNHPNLKALIENIKHIGIKHVSLLPVEDMEGYMVIEIPVELEFMVNGRGSQQQKTVHFLLQKNSLLEGWKIHQDTLNEFFYIMEEENPMRKHLPF